MVNPHELSPRGHPISHTRRCGGVVRKLLGHIGEPDENAVDHVLSQFRRSERQRLDELLDAAADAVQAWARDGTNKAANRFNAFELRPGDDERAAPPGAVDGPPGADGIRRTKTGWRRARPGETPE